MTTAAGHLHPAERLVFFTDAVVAIAMTLLILPLLESVTDAAAHGLDTLGYLREHDGQLAAFVLSFVIIARFWRGHDRLFVNVERQGPTLLWLNVAWMFTIVWLPVATAMVGAMETDRLQLAIYIGTMLATSLCQLAMLLLVRRDRRLRRSGTPPEARSVRSAVLVSVLFGVALALALLVPGVQFWALLVLLLTPALEWLLRLRDGRG